MDHEVDHEHTYKYMWLLKGIASFDLKTNNTTEGLNGTFVFARDQVPYRMNYKLCKWVGEHFAMHLAEALKAQAAVKLLTTWAEMLFRENVCAHARVPKVRVLKVRVCPLDPLTCDPLTTDRDCSEVRAHCAARRRRFILRRWWPNWEIIRGGFGQ